MNVIERLTRLQIWLEYEDLTDGDVINDIDSELEEIKELLIMKGEGYHEIHEDSY